MDLLTAVDSRPTADNEWAASAAAFWGQSTGFSPSSVVAVPVSLHASLMARLDRLGPGKELAPQCLAQPANCPVKRDAHQAPSNGSLLLCVPRSSSVSPQANLSWLK